MRKQVLKSRKKRQRMRARWQEVSTRLVPRRAKLRRRKHARIWRRPPATSKRQRPLPSQTRKQVFKSRKKRQRQQPRRSVCYSGEVCFRGEVCSWTSKQTHIK